MYRTLLVPLDGSPFGEQALPLARRLAQRSGATLHLVHVHVPIVPMAMHGMPAFDVSIDEQVRASEQGYLDAVAQRLAASTELSLTAMLLDAPIVAALHDYSVKFGVDLVVMTTHGRGMVSRFWLGSIADRLMREVVVPVLLVRPQAEPVPEADRAPSIKQMLIPVDGSALAEQIIPQAIALGRLARAEYTLLHVIEPIAEAYGMELSRAGFDAAGLARMRAVAQDYLDGVAARFQAEGLRVRTVVDTDPTPQAILEYARVHAIDLIALATHGRGGVARLLLGSVADKLVRSATIPVLLQRPREEAPAH